MNYDKQVALTDNELNKLRENCRACYIKCIPHYQNNNIHLIAHLGIETGFSITRNMDSYIFEYVKGKSVTQPENKWVVMADNSDKFPNCFKYNKAFDDLNEAIEYVLKTRESQLLFELNSIKNKQKLIKQ